jgi:hypothetical protein
MAAGHVIVDGSNIATEGGSVPSLAQLQEAVTALRAERPDDRVTVVVDASFEYRIDASERAAFEAAEAAGEIVSPPAGAIGRGDGFLLQIADRTGAAILSNDSFQEFHGEYEWLFEEGRLFGGKPVPGVGWIFSVRTPVRGPRSRQAVRDARRQSGRAAAVEDAIAEATEDVLQPTSSGASRRRRRRGSSPPPGAVNDPLPFITFIANHRLGDEVEGEVDQFSSHGAFVIAEGARCYVPLTAMGDPPPRSARQALRRGDRHRFVVQAFDAARRGIELALPGFAQVAAGPTDETVKAEIRGTSVPARKKAPPRKRAAEKKTAARKKATARSQAGARQKAGAAARETAQKAAPKKPAARKQALKKAPPKKQAPKKQAARRVAPEKAVTKKATTKASKPRRARKKAAAS